VTRPLILLVDDDPSLRRLIKMTLPEEGIDVEEAEDGIEALARIEAREPDLLVLDWKMPKKSGEQVLAVVKDRHPQLPVIVLTAERQPADRAAAEQLGADAFLTKPFSPLELLGSVERLLGDRLSTSDSG
jgi:two-component system, OmpR family, response regulator